MSCLPCSRANAQEQDAFKYYRGIYDKTGQEYFVYKLSTKDGYKIVKSQYFNEIFETQIKPNFENGAEYFSIREVSRN